jgi:hypothetical protein
MRIFVGTLTFTTTEEALAQLFAPYGSVALGEPSNADSTWQLLPMTVPNDALSAPKTLLNRPRVKAARKKTTQSKMSC